SHFDDSTPTRLDIFTTLHPTELLLTLNRHPPGCPLFPYTTLFRSRAQARARLALALEREGLHADGLDPLAPRPLTSGARADRARSEEHTSELQSRENLVCRLLLEKKKIVKSKSQEGKVHSSAVVSD